MDDQVARIGDQRLQPMTALLEVCLSNGRPAPIALWLTPKMDAPTYEADKSQSAVKDFHEQALLAFTVGRGYAAEVRLCSRLVVRLLRVEVTSLLAWSLVTLRRGKLSRQPLGGTRQTASSLVHDAGLQGASPFSLIMHCEGHRSERKRLIAGPEGHRNHHLVTFYKSDVTGARDCFADGGNLTNQRKHVRGHQLSYLINRIRIECCSHHTL